jgi:hypothetical protein
MGEPVTDVRTQSGTASRRSVSPFAAFAIVAAIAIFGALWEDSYWTTNPALWAASLPTTLGIAAAAVVFFLLAWRAPAND